MQKETHFFHIVKLCVFKLSETPFLKGQKLFFYVLNININESK